MTVTYVINIIVVSTDNTYDNPSRYLFAMRKNHFHILTSRGINAQRQKYPISKPILQSLIGMCLLTRLR